MGFFQWTSEIALPLRLACLFVLGAIVGGALNLATYRLAWQQRSFSPWSAAPAGAGPRGWFDRIPILGWFSLARESSLHGPRHWVRPLLVEVATGLLFAGLYWWEIESTGMYFQLLIGAPPPGALVTENFELVRHLQYLSGLILFSLMIVASLIDFDEKTIPDAITVPGALAGLALALAYPWSLPPGAAWMFNVVPSVEFVTLTAPEPWPTDLGGLPLWQPLAIALGCWTVWCGGLMPRRWNVRHGWGTAVRVFVHRLLRDRSTYVCLVLWAVGAVAIGLAAWRAPAENWGGLLTALVGLLASGGIVWLVRVIGSAALGREAMGFGDVTLMAMIGAFVGWQAALMVFFIAPFVALLLALVQWVLRGEHEIPFGPFLCLATAVVVIRWAACWEAGQGIFMLGWWVPGLLGVCLILMGVLLAGYRATLRLMTGRG